MRRIRALLRETWWLWAAFYTSCWLLQHYVEPFMIVTFPILTLVLLYFAFVRFDGEGNARH